MRVLFLDDSLRKNENYKFSSLSAHLDGGMIEAKEADSIGLVTILF